jgi:nitroreductase
MDLFEAIEKRYSYRGEFASMPIPREHLQKIVAAGIRAPSACNQQVVSFVIVDDPDLLEKIAKTIDRPVCFTAKAMIVCITDPRPVYQEMSFAAEDCGAAVENMLLATTALGYATVWLDGALKVENRAERVGRLLGAPPEYIVAVVLPLGVAKQPGTPRERSPFDQRAWFNKYGNTEDDLS